MSDDWSRWQEWYDSLTWGQRFARWWSIHWAPLFAFGAILTIAALVGWWLT